MGTAPSQKLAGRTLVMSGGSRGIGLAILVAAAREGANTVFLAKTDQPDPRLPGTVHTAVAEIEAAGGKAVAVVGDVRNEEDVQRAVDTAVETFGGIDICVNNASALNLTGTEELPVKRFDLMQQINTRGTFVLTKACIPHLKRSDAAQILTLSPPISLAPHWLGPHPAYTLSKYGMTLLTLGFAAEFESDGIAANCLWPRTTIATAAVINLIPDAANASRSPEIMGDAAVAIFTGPWRSGECLIDDDVLAAAGVTDLSKYGAGPDFAPDLFVDSVS
ncbi:SDR family oxidoreductase [Sporichthya polymorpha]|uniref:SDR family oxidoreductase n=1 Tax=Sporichthya polymorpha TaxID=35751 RepID=UPI00035C1E05|nr:NAD(P)-dependent oxidoreductase [Sporichthya polymorpha]